VAVTEEELVRHYPRLWHMAHGGSWPAIRENGLLSTTALLDLYEVAPPRRKVIEASRRSDLVTLDGKNLPRAVVRDQKPMTDSALSKCLQDGLTAPEWYRILNKRTFFWVSRKRLWRLLKARAYRSNPQTVLTLDTKSLISSHRASVELSPINSGSTIFNPQPRGLATFRSIAEYPFEEMRKRRGVRDAVVELIVIGGVRDVCEHVLTAHDVRNGKQNLLWKREDAVGLEELGLGRPRGLEASVARKRAQIEDRSI
jgi:hypothetical protein